MHELAAGGGQVVVGVSASGIIVPSCNPLDGGYPDFLAAAGNGSWLGVIPGRGGGLWVHPMMGGHVSSLTRVRSCTSMLPSHAGASHTSVLDGGFLVNAAADLVCSRGTDSREEVAALTATPMLAWLWQQLVGQGRQSAQQQQEQQQQQQQTVGSSAPGGVADTPSPMPAFYEWVQQQGATGKLDFLITADLITGNGGVFTPPKTQSSIS